MPLSAMSKCYLLLICSGYAGAAVVKDTSCDPSLETCTVDAAAATAAASAMQTNRQEMRQHFHMRRADCSDNDAGLVAAAQEIGQTTAGCAHAAAKCDHATLGAGIRWFCPKSC